MLHASGGEGFVDVGEGSHRRGSSFGGRQSSTARARLPPRRGGTIWQWTRPDPNAQPGLVATPPTAARTRWLRLAGDLLLIVGGLVLAYPFWSAAYAQVQQTRLDSTYREQSVAFVQDINAEPGHTHAP